ncbi:MAG: zinc ribbon domain-containing protein [Candidatus Thermofonsia Clade 1 bacterium]|jgi:putative FmdB family regulatory protein|uniref:Zinc ribbon domain-containing protein n=1 Tax=Candidatus Thermofonsia Clade 1 bacterium TaxID=2364210 RepID=A0A2M8PYH7_9CHLR|nr:MAG: zinc ribbon domain-containing protein [Candidatus Thermofonsia Clade 1 bacterium]PJF42589.1 MAG: zinc ribbon domain-containing protein [Candidatus Thermofonsia Clade 1 bacterium]RMF50526.1 MAG: zinc ribbon domain-containing protein [Chloroflexota bacterium]
MPIYEYVCQSCQTQFEKRVSAEKADEAICPECGAKEVKRKLSRVMVQIGEISASSAPSYTDSAPSCGCGTGLCGLPSKN